MSGNWQPLWKTVRDRETYVNQCEFEELLETLEDEIQEGMTFHQLEIILDLVRLLKRKEASTSRCVK